MKIAFLSKDYPPDLIGGVGTYVYEVSRLLAKKSHTVFVVTCAKDIPLEYTDAGVTVFRVKAKRLKVLDHLRTKIGGLIERLEYSLAVSGKIDEIVKHYGLDLIETSEARAEGFWYYFFHKHPPLIIKLHTPETFAFALDHTPDTLDYRLIKSLEERWLQKASRKIGLSPDVVELTARHFKTRLGNVPSVPNPIDINFFKPSHDALLNDFPHILYVGRLEFRKGIHTLIRAFSYIQDSFPYARLTLIGADCGMKGYLFEKIAKLKYPDRVIWIDRIPRENLLEHYRNSSVCVVPSIWENYPYVCLEAMACAKPVIASDIGGLSTMIRHGENGLLFTPGSSRQLAERLTYLLKNPQLMRQFGLAARRSIEETYAPEKIAEATLQIYESLLKH
jgi:glycosyltransferase involved in cell wall biosynthesis